MKKLSKPPVQKRRSPPQAQTSVGHKLRVVYTQGRIQKRVGELVAQINRDYRGKTLHVVGILENCFMFMGDLVRALKLPVICYFIRPQVRDSTSGAVAMREIRYTPSVEAAGRDVLLVDGVLQSGLTLDHLYRYILGQNPSSVRTVVLVEKTDERKVDVATDYVGFQSDAKFLVGYGLGYQDQYRNLPYIARLA